jgi:uncharacterized membrane protein
MPIGILVVFSVAALVGVIGITLLVISNVSYFRRTRDQSFGGGRFWLRADVLTRREYLMNRGGFGLAVVGLVGMLSAPLFS